jgi:hypothetical protein
MTAREIVAAMRQAAADLLASLDEATRSALVSRLDDGAQRRDWAYFPRRYAGVGMGALTMEQQKHVHRLVSAGLGYAAYSKTVTIMALERLVDLDEARRLTAIRDPSRYFVRLFGLPDGPAWGWQFEGHHVSLNTTIAGDDLVSPTPLFLGAQPANVEHGGSTVLRILEEEEDLGRELLVSLDAEQRSRAVLCDVAPPDFVLMNAPRVPERWLPGEEVALPQVRERFDEMTTEQKHALAFERERPSGLSASAMTAAQRELLSALVDAYVGRTPDAIARIERGKIDARGLERLTFAWAGPAERGAPHYYRVHGPSLLIEWDNTQDGANHAHSVWRDPEGDFGGDVLREHVAARP